MLAGAAPVLVHNSPPCSPDLDALSASGMRPVKGKTTDAAREYQKHIDREDLPVVPGRQLKTAGQDLLDDILTNPGAAGLAQRSTQVVCSSTFGGIRYVDDSAMGCSCP